MKTGQGLIYNMVQDQNKIPVNLECEYDNFEKKIINLKDIGAMFQTVSAHRCEDEGFQLNYYFQQGDRRIILRVKSRDDSIPSLYSYFGIADFLEREINNLFGIKFIGHPNLERIPRKKKHPAAEPYRVDDTESQD